MKLAMGGPDRRTEGLFSYVSCATRVPARHLLRSILPIADAPLAALRGAFQQLYALNGRLSIAPEKLLRALLLQAFYSVRSERQLMEQLDYILLFRWFVGLGVDDPVCDVTLAPGRNGARDCHGEQRTNDTHASTTHPEARLFRKGKGKEVKRKDPRGGHPARHLPADLPRQVNRRARCDGASGELPAPGRRLVDRRPLGAGVFKNDLDFDAVDGAAGPYDFANLLVDWVRVGPPTGLTPAGGAACASPTTPWCSRASSTS